MTSEYILRRRRFIAILSIIAIFLFSQIYIFSSISSLKRNQANHYEEFNNDIEILNSKYNTQVEGLQESYNNKLERLGEYVEYTKEEYSEQTQQLMDIVEEREKEKEVQLQALRDELHNINKGVADLAGRVLKSAVSIGTNDSQGSGAVLTKEGYIVTNYHVIRGYENVTVSTSDGEILNGNILLTDVMRDIAIIKVDKKFEDYLPLGDSDKILVGEQVIAIGSPEKLDFTVTQGIVSSKSRIFNQDEGSFIQTDVPINSGSSGGPLINSNGEIIGINTFKLEDSESLGFAIPSNDVRKLLIKAVLLER